MDYGTIVVDAYIYFSINLTNWSMSKKINLTKQKISYILYEKAPLPVWEGLNMRLSVLNKWFCSVDLHSTSQLCSSHALPMGFLVNTIQPGWCKCNCTIRYYKYFPSSMRDDLCTEVVDDNEPPYKGIVVKVNQLKKSKISAWRFFIHLTTSRNMKLQKSRS